MRATKIAPHIYTRGHTRHTYWPRVTDMIREYSIDVVLNVANIPDPRFEESMFPVYYHCPLSDGENLDMERTVVPVNLIVASVEHERNILVHCDAGRNRTGLVVALALLQITTHTPEEVLELMRTARPGFLANRYFEAYVLAQGRRA